MITLCVATMEQPSLRKYPGDIDGWLEHMSPETQNSSRILVQYNTPEKNLGVVGSYEKLYKQTTVGDIFMFIHDDVVCREDKWDLRVLREFEDPSVGLVGFGGALWHGVPDLYKVPYRLQNLIRGNYRSNVDDAEVHGERFIGSCNVAVLDGYCLIVRRSILDRIGGFALFPEHSHYFCYDYVLSALCRRLGFSVRLLGIRCHHRGGSASVSTKGFQNSQEAYDLSHRWFYDNFKDVMPVQVYP